MMKEEVCDDYLDEVKATTYISRSDCYGSIFSAPPSTCHIPASYAIELQILLTSTIPDA